MVKAERKEHNLKHNIPIEFTGPGHKGKGALVTPSTEPMSEAAAVGMAGTGMKHHLEQMQRGVTNAGVHYAVQIEEAQVDGQGNKQVEARTVDVSATEACYAAYWRQKLLRESGGAAAAAPVATPTSSTSGMELEGGQAWMTQMGS